jgi:penicillin-binding protein 1A
MAKSSRRGPARGSALPVHADERRTGPAKPSSKSKSKPKRARRPLPLRIAYWGFVVGLWLAIGAGGGVAWVGAHLPPIQSLDIPKRPPTIDIVDLDGKPLARRGDLAGPPVSIRTLPKYVPNAFVAIEDRRFYQHFGVDPFGIARAAVANVLHRGVAQGGSTITQQLAKNLFLTQERTLTRKLQEALLAVWLERRFSKQEILELYLNRVYFGAGAWGVEQAAQHYFEKPASELTIAEAAMLAGLVKSPSRLAPTRNYEEAEKRAKIVLAAMADSGFINATSEKLALAHPPRVIAQAGNDSVNYVADWVMDIIDDLLGHVEEDIVVRTTIDPALQAAGEAALAQELAAKGEKLKVGQGALVSMAPDGAVRALIGGKSYAESQFNRAVAARRQSGSAFKAFVFLTALEHGLTPDSVREDAPINVRGWKPGNYEHGYLGPVTLTKALALSLNTVSVRLTLEVTPQAVVRTAYRLGIASRLEPNASIALGTSEVSPLELTGAYATFANGGIGVSPHVIDRITGVHGKLLYSRSREPLGRVADQRTVAMMDAMMQQTLAIGTAKKASLPGWNAAGKTGTSQDFRDAWFIGFTSHLVTSVWVGNDDNSPTKHVTGGSLPVDIWSSFMRTAHQGVPLASLPVDTGPRLFSGFFNQAQAPASDSAPVQPREPIQPASVRPPAARDLNDRLMQGLFGRR